MWQKIAKISPAGHANASLAGWQKFSVITLVAKLALVGVFVLFANTVNAQALEISDIEVNADNGQVTIGWQTNLVSTGKIDLGVSNQYGRVLPEQVPATRNHQINLSALETDTTYHYRITAYADGQEVSTFDQVFSTKDFNDRVFPKIDDVHVAYITGTVATIQWETSEPTSFVLYYGKTTAYGSKKSSSSRKTTWQVNLTKLKTDTTYHFKLRIKDKDGNVVNYRDVAFTTKDNKNAEENKLKISDIKPVSVNDGLVQNTSATITWRTNKIATSVVRYGTKATKLNKTATVKDALSNFNHEIIIKKLKPETAYYFRVESKDAFGKTIKSDVKSFVTKPLPVVLGTREVQMAVNKANKTSASQLYKVGEKTYALLNGTKHYISSLEVFNRNGYSWSNVKDVSQNFVNNLPDTKLVKSPDNSTVYYLYKKGDNNFIRIAIPNAQVFDSYPQNSWSKIATIDQLDINQYNTANLIKTKDNSAVYLLENNLKRLIDSEKAFLQAGYDWADIVEVNTTHLNSYTTGAIIK